MRLRQKSQFSKSFHSPAVSCPAGIPSGEQGSTTQTSPPEPPPEPEPEASLLRLQDTFTHEAMGTDFSFTIYTKPGAESTSDIRLRHSDS